MFLLLFFFCFTIWGFSQKKKNPFHHKNKRKNRQQFIRTLSIDECVRHVSYRFWFLVFLFVSLLSINFIMLAAELSQFYYDYINIFDFRYFFFFFYLFWFLLLLRTLMMRYPIIRKNPFYFSFAVGFCVWFKIMCLDEFLLLIEIVDRSLNL